jgi:hypothetical protein
MAAPTPEELDILEGGGDGGFGRLEGAGDAEIRKNME